MTITKRTTKGSALTYAELDENFRDLDSGMTLDRVLRNGDSSNSNATILGNVSLGNVTVNSLDFARPGGLASHGYAIGGATGPAQTTDVSTADKFPFAADDTIISEQIVALSSAKRHVGSNASSTHAYSTGATNVSGNNAVTSAIEKFSFAEQINRISNVGDLSTVRVLMNDATQSLTHGYQAGGELGGGGSPATGASNVIDKFPFSSDTNATDVGDLTSARDFITQPGSATHGYAAGGRTFPFSTNTAKNVIEKYPFSSDANAADVGDLAISRVHRASSQNSDTNGYVSGGRTGPPGSVLDDIQKFPFAADANATNVGNLSYARYGNAGSSSQSKGYMHGGGRFTGPTPFATHDDISAFPFATDAAVAFPAALSNNRWIHGGTEG